MVSMSEVFWVGLYTSGIAFILALTRQLYKSKCQSLKCCGCELLRDTEAEEKIDELEMERHPTTTLPSDTKTLPS
jgi:hypothetical protein